MPLLFMNSLHNRMRDPKYHTLCGRISIPADPAGVLYRLTIKVLKLVHSSKFSNQA
jgi:hypothetical protein